MAIRSASDLVYTLIARLPLLLVVAGLLWVLYTGVLGLETYSFGTEYLIGNDESSNALPTIGNGPTDEEILAAIESGDVERMSAVLDAAAADSAAVSQSSGAVARPGFMG